MPASPAAILVAIGALVDQLQDWRALGGVLLLSDGSALSAGVPQIMRQDLRCYYLMYAARYMQAIVSVLMEHRRKDFIEMQATDLEKATATRMARTRMLAVMC